MKPSHSVRLLVSISIAGLFAFPCARALLCCSNPKIIGCTGCAMDCARPPWCDDPESLELLQPSSLRTQRSGDDGANAANQVVGVPLGPPSIFERIVPPSLFDTLNPCLICDWNVYVWFM